MALDESIIPGDITDDVNGIPIVYQKNLAHFFEEVSIDYVDTPYGREFVIRSPFDSGC